MKVSMLYMLSLARSSIYGVNPDVPEKKVNWHYIWKCANRQGIVGLLGNAVIKLPEYEQPFNIELWKEACLKTFVCMNKRYFEFENVCREACDAGIKIICMKGIVSKDLYPIPELRTMGDFDIFVTENYNKMKSVMKNRGYSISELFHMPKETKDRGKRINVGFIAVGHGVVWEVFNTLREEFEYNTYNVERRIIDNKIIWRNGLNAMKKEDMLAHMIIHHAKHLEYEGAGIRNILDIVLFLKKNSENIDFDYVIAMCEEQGYKKIAELAFGVAEQYFGIKVGYKYEKHNTEFFLRHMLSGGVFGIHTGDKILNQVSRYRGDQSWIKSVLFPPLEVLKDRYPYLKKKPMLLPVAWAQRLVNGIGEIRKLPFGKIVLGTRKSIMYSVTHKYVLKKLDIKR